MIKCKNCGAIIDSNYCPECGQKRHTSKDNSISHLFEEVFHFITHFEGSFFTTLKTVLFHPSKLTVDYCNGIRKKYFKPVSFFLFIVVLYLIFPLFTGLNMEMKYYKTLPLGGTLITHQIENKLKKNEYTEEKLSSKFELKSHSISKFMLFLFIPLSGMLIYLLYLRNKRPFYDLLILATEINIIYLMVFFLILPIFYMLFLYIFNITNLDNEVVGIVNTLLFGFYVTVIFKKIFKSKLWSSLLRGLLFAFFHAFIILLIYKFLVFEITYFLI